MSGVFNWMLAGLSRLLLNKDFTQSNIVKNEILQYQKESDSVLMFIDEEDYRPSIEARKNRTEVYSEYQRFCLDNGNRPLAAGRFYKRMKGNGFDVPNKASNGIRYIYLDRG